MEGDSTISSSQTFEDRSDRDNLIVPLANLIKDEIRNELRSLNLVEKSELKTFIQDIQKFQKMEIPRSISEVVKNESSPSTYANISDLEINDTYTSTSPYTTTPYTTSPYTTTPYTTSPYTTSPYTTSLYTSQKLSNDETDQTRTDNFTVDTSLSKTSIISLKESKELMQRFESLETKVNKMIEILEPLTEINQVAASNESKYRNSKRIDRMKQIINEYDELFYVERQRRLNLTTYKKSERTLNFNKRPKNTQFAIMPAKSQLLKRLTEAEKLQMGCDSVFLTRNPKASLKRLFKRNIT